MGIREWALRTLGASSAVEYEQEIKVLGKSIKIKDSQIHTLEVMLEEQHKGHINELKGINNKLDFVVDSYQRQKNEMEAITKELLWQREEALVWRERLEVKLELDAERISPTQELIDIEKRRDDKKRSEEA